MDLLSLLFPPRCLGCREIGTYLCPECVNFFVPLNELYCPRCRKFSRWGQTHSTCKKWSDIDGVMSGYAYTGLMKGAIQKFKYTLVTALTETLVELMVSGITHPDLFRRDWVVVPVPLHPKRLKWRGFNQAELLAEGLARAWQFPLLSNVLRRCRPTAPQMTLAGAKRKQNLKNAFNITSGSIIPSHILLVDDVITTGSTLNEGAAVLKQAGARVVWGVTLAQTIPHGESGFF